MITYITFAFWAGIVGVVIRILQLMICDYPRVVKNSLGSDTAMLIIAIGFLGWAAALKYGLIQ